MKTPKKWPAVIYTDAKPFKAPRRRRPRAAGLYLNMFAGLRIMCMICGREIQDGCTHGRSA